MLQPNARHWNCSVVREIDSPNQTGDRVGDKDHSRTDQAAAIESAGSIGKIKDLLGLDRVTNTPVAHVDAVKAGSVIGVDVRRTQIENIRLNLGEAQSELVKGVLKRTSLR